MLQKLPTLANWEPTRNTLHPYSKVVGAVPRAFAEPHPKWWHISLKMGDMGLETDLFTITDGRQLQLQMDMQEHAIKVYMDASLSLELDMQANPSATDMANSIENHLQNLGVAVSLDRSKFEGNIIEGYDPVVAQTYYEVLKTIAGVMQAVKASIGEGTGIINFWPHNFDLAFEWFSKKAIIYESNGGSLESPAQINFGFTPGDSTHPRPYFYSNPWPFDATLMNTDLPAEAQWFRGQWEGSLLAYDSLVGGEAYQSKLKDYYLTIFHTASPGLMP